MRRGLPVATLLCLLVGPVFSCKDKTEVAKDQPGEAAQKVETAQEACAVRGKWEHQLHKKCTTCLSLAAAPACGCKTDEKEFSGHCAKEQSAKTRAKECKSVWECSYKCKKGDCACFDKCYEAEKACNDIVSALDACLVKVCDPYCR